MPFRGCNGIKRLGLERAERVSESGRSLDFNIRKTISCSVDNGGLWMGRRADWLYESGVVGVRSEVFG